MATIRNNSGFSVRESDLIVTLDSDYVNQNRIIAPSGTSTITNRYAQYNTNQFGTSSLNSRWQQQTIQSVVSESINIQGVTVKYIFRQNTDTVDELWNEHPEATWGNPLDVDMYIESYDAPGGDGQVLSQYGIEFNDQITLTMSQETWANLVGRPADHHRPDGGDLIVVPFGISASNQDNYLPKVFQINDVSTFRNGAPFYQLGDNFVFRITGALFTRAGETIDFGGGPDSITQAIINATDTSGSSPLFRDSDSDLHIDDHDQFADNRIIEIISAGTDSDSAIVVGDFSGKQRWARQGAVFTSDSDLMDIGDF